MPLRLPRHSLQEATRLASMALDRVPLASDRIVGGEPVIREKPRSLGRTFPLIGADRWASVWDCTEGSFQHKFAKDTIMQVIAGEVVLSSEEILSHSVQAGDITQFSSGSTLIFTVPHYVRVYTISNDQHFFANDACPRDSAIRTYLDRVRLTWMKISGLFVTTPASEGSRL